MPSARLHRGRLLLIYKTFLSPVLKWARWSPCYISRTAILLLPGLTVAMTLPSKHILWQRAHVCSFAAQAGAAGGWCHHSAVCPVDAAASGIWCTWSLQSPDVLAMHQHYNSCLRHRPAFLHPLEAVALRCAWTTCTATHVCNSAGPRKGTAPGLVMERAVQEMSQLRQEIARFMAQHEQGAPALPCRLSVCR